MARNWYFKKGYSRTLKSGRVVWVGEHYYFRDTREDEASKKAKRRTSNCPHCNAPIHSFRMANGGWGHFEGGQVHLGTLHPCFTIGRSLSKKRPENIADLFSDAEGTNTEE